MPGLTIFGAGSYGRHEASTHSDIDLFFLIDGKNDAIPEPRTSSLRLFAKVIETVDLMSFPKLSNDCEYLELLSTADILYHLGSRTDDSANYFTARMLLLLEGQCLHGSIVYEKVLKDVVDSYFNDFPDHKQTFSPMFLVNDICRFWKTMLLNYENRRGLRDPAAATEDRKTKHKVRNFKLKFSRMTTCFASVAALGSFSAPVTPNRIAAGIAAHAEGPRMIVASNKPRNTSHSLTKPLSGGSPLMAAAPSANRPAVHGIARHSPPNRLISPVPVACSTDPAPRNSRPLNKP